MYPNLTEALNNLHNDETRADVSDWAANTIRDAFGSNASALVFEEQSRIMGEGITTMLGYLRARRAGSAYRLNRGMRMVVWAYIATRAAR